MRDQAQSGSAPAIAAPLPRAALLDHRDRELPDYALFAHSAGGLLLTRRMRTSSPAPPPSRANLFRVNQVRLQQ